MQYFSPPSIQQAIERLQNYSANWLLPAFVFAANDVGTDEFVDMSHRLGTDQFLDRYFNGQLLSLPNLENGNNLLRPRLKGITWNRGPFAGDFIIQQDTKMWGNLFSSRGYREMRLEGLIEGEKAIVKLTDAFQPRFEQEIPASFRFEDLLVWIFAFRGFPDEIAGWPALYEHFLKDELGLATFKAPYRNRFKLSDPSPPWPELFHDRPSNVEFLDKLAPKLAAHMAEPKANSKAPKDEDTLGVDDPIYTAVKSAVQAGESLTFLLAGPPGTGKTRYARLLAKALTKDKEDRMLFVQFHPAIGYDDFVEGFRPAEGDKGTVKYDLGPRLFLNFAELADKNRTDTFVAVIDELNRGDVARIFGEMLTYLEVDYREKEFTLPFSGRPAKLPKNLIVLATANPYDRSVTDLDEALLRRFWVIEIDPDGAFLEAHLKNKGVIENVVRRTVRAFTILNKRFPNGFGHTNFLGVRNLDDLAAVWMGRVRLALKRAFIHDRETFEAISTEIEALLRTRDDPEEAEEKEVS